MLGTAQRICLENPLKRILGKECLPMHNLYQKISGI
jgi:hypothetical protein